MNVNEQSQNRLAVLIDADNAQPSITEGLLSEVAKYGVASVKRIYDDWSTPSLTGWKSVLLEHSIQPPRPVAQGQIQGKTADLKGCSK